MGSGFRTSGGILGSGYHLLLASSDSEAGGGLLGSGFRTSGGILEKFMLLNLKGGGKKMMVQITLSQ